MFEFDSKELYEKRILGPTLGGKSIDICQMALQEVNKF